jgi:hypothetical protein
MVYCARLALLLAQYRVQTVIWGEKLVLNGGFLFFYMQPFHVQ